MKILIITDGKMGDLVPCRGVASHLTSSDNIQEHVVRVSGWHALPFSFIGPAPADRAGQPTSPLNAPLPDCVIASGRRTLPLLQAFHRLRGDASRPLTVFLKSPGRNRNIAKIADIVWIPDHDRMDGANVVTTATSPHRFTSEVLENLRKQGKARFGAMGQGATGVMLGGNAKPVQWTEEMAQEFAAHLTKLPASTPVLVTPSRRTPDILLQATRHALQNRPHWIWDGHGENPYGQILACCDPIIVTGDSHNMVSESLATSARIYVFRPAGMKKKFHYFLDAMEKTGALQDIAHLGEPSPSHLREPLDATVEIADMIRKKIRVLGIGSHAPQA